MSDNVIMNINLQAMDEVELDEFLRLLRKTDKKGQDMMLLVMQSVKVGSHLNDFYEKGEKPNEVTKKLC